MAVIPLTITVSTTATRLAGAATVFNGRAQLTIVPQGTIRLGTATSEYADPGLPLTSGQAFTELYDPANLYATCSTGTVTVDAILTGDVSA